MRIAVVTQYFPIKKSLYKGHSAYQTLRRLAEKVEVEVFIPQIQYPSLLMPDHGLWGTVELDFSVPEMKTTYFGYPGIPVISRPFNGYVCEHYLEPHLRKSKFDLLLNYWLYPDGFATARLGRKF